ncbi:helix-turn-helix domain-containing protein [Thermomonas sp. S9]|nr:helix-turn-helix domain-containing protein [Thermomonas sp. S9]
MKSDAELGQRLRAWRQTLGLTQAQMAERLGLHIGVLKSMRPGRTRPEERPSPPTPAREST